MNMDTVLSALADPNRRAIVGLLREGERPVGFLVEQLPIAQSGVSRHLRILRDAGVVASRTEGQRRVYSLCPEPFQELSDWLADVRQIWEERLDNLEAELHRRQLESNDE
jgi:DNA-binding transcriptional ArsR family regulator